MSIKRAMHLTLALTLLIPPTALGQGTGWVQDDAISITPGGWTPRFVDWNNGTPYVSVYTMDLEGEGYEPEATELLFGPNTPPPLEGVVHYASAWHNGKQSLLETHTTPDGSILSQIVDGQRRELAVLPEQFLWMRTIPTDHGTVIGLSGPVREQDDWLAIGLFDGDTFQLWWEHRSEGVKIQYETIASDGQTGAALRHIHVFPLVQGRYLSLIEAVGGIAAPTPIDPPDVYVLRILLDMDHVLLVRQQTAGLELLGRDGTWTLQQEEPFPTGAAMVARDFGVCSTPESTFVALDYLLDGGFRQVDVWEWDGDRFALAFSTPDLAFPAIGCGVPGEVAVAGVEVGINASVVVRHFVKGHATPAPNNTDPGQNVTIEPDRSVPFPAGAVGLASLVAAMVARRPGRGRGAGGSRGAKLGAPLGPSVE